MVKEAWKYNVHCRSSSPEKALVDSLNLAWEHHDEPCSQFANTIACVDTSASMTWDFGNPYTRYFFSQEYKKMGKPELPCGIHFRSAFINYSVIKMKK